MSDRRTTGKRLVDVRGPFAVSVAIRNQVRVMRLPCGNSRLAKGTVRIDGNSRHDDANSTVNDPIGPGAPVPRRWLELCAQLRLPFSVWAVGVIAIGPMLAFEFLI